MRDIKLNSNFATNDERYFFFLFVVIGFNDLNSFNMFPSLDKGILVFLFFFFLTSEIFLQ